MQSSEDITKILFCCGSFKVNVWKSNHTVFKIGLIVKCSLTSLEVSSHQCITPYLIGDHEDFVLGAESPHALEVAVVGDHHPRLPLDRLHHEGRRVRVLGI